MATAAQIRANRENAQRSTGPRTEAGKESAKFNALTHGLAAEKLVIRGEDPTQFEALRAQLRSDHAPADETESMLVEEIAQGWWRLQRARAQENRSIHVSMMSGQPFNDKDLGPVLRYMTSVERAWNRAIAQLRTLQNDRRKRESATEASQPEEKAKVMAVGSVPQDEPEPPEAAAAPAQPALPFRPDIAARRAKLDRQMAIVERELRGSATRDGEID